MCPASVASVALTAGGVITTGGLSALVEDIHTKKSAKKNGLDNIANKEK